VKDGGAAQLLAPSGSAPVVSGLRVMYRVGGGYRLRDLRPGGGTSTLPTAAGYALWGDYLVSVSSTGEIRRRSLSNGTTSVVRAATPAGPSLVVDAQHVAAYGDVVAWFQTMPLPGGSDVSLWWHNVVTGSNRHVTVADPGALRVGAHDIVWDDRPASPGHPHVLDRVTLTSTAITTVSNSISRASTFSVDDERLALVGSDGLARVTPLPAFVARPRYLGLRYAETYFEPGKANPVWDLETTFSKALSSCTVTIKRNGAVVRTLGCVTASGAVVVAWTGTTSGGAQAPVGSYTWVLSARDADGAIASPSGGAITVSGSISKRS
jgi:hypothetical protein